MNITEQTSNNLNLEDHNHQWIGGMLLGIPFVMVGWFTLLSSSTVTDLTCQRIEPAKLSCQRTTSGLLETTIEAIPGQVSGANALTGHSTGVVLKTSNGTVALANHRGFISEKNDQVATQINILVNNSQQNTFKVSLDDRWEGFLWSLQFGLPGIVITLGSLTFPIQVCCKFDKTLEQMTLEKRYLLSGVRLTQYRLSDLHSVEVFQLPNAYRTPLYVVRSHLTSKQQVILTPPSHDRAQFQTIATAINHFLR